jgi:signal transduction histidine kinase
MSIIASEVDEGRLLLELTRDVTSSLDLQEVLDKALASLRRLIDFNGGSIQLIEDGALRMVAGDPPPPPEAFEFRLPVGQGFGGRVAETGELIYSPDATTDPRAHPEGRKKASVAGTHSWFGAPLIVHGQTIGVVQLDDLRVDHFPAPVQARILSFLPIVSAAVQNALLYQQERDVVIRLVETERLKRDFVATVSHELKTPLTLVRGFANVLAHADDRLATSQILDIGQRIEGAAARLEEMIRDLLVISGIEHGSLAVSIDVVALDTILTPAVQQADAGTHVLELSFPENLPEVATDPVRLVEVLTKLLDNAQKFSEPGAVVRVSAEVGESGVTVAIEDHGRGIPAAIVEHVFEPFVQADSSNTRSAGGMGIGLFLVRRLCEALGIDLSVTSELGEGSRFVLVVPLAAG